MSDTRTFKQGEAVIIYDGGRKRNSIELAQVGKDCSYAEDKVLITFGAFNSAYSKSSVHKLPTTLKRELTKGDKE